MSDEQISRSIKYVCEMICWLALLFALVTCSLQRMPWQPEPPKQVEKP